MIKKINKILEISEILLSLGKIFDMSNRDKGYELKNLDIDKDTVYGKIVKEYIKFINSYWRGRNILKKVVIKIYKDVGMEEGMEEEQLQKTLEVFGVGRIVVYIQNSGYNNPIYEHTYKFVDEEDEKDTVTWVDALYKNILYEGFMSFVMLYENQKTIQN